MASVPLISMFHRAAPVKRLWMGAGALGVFILTLAIGNEFIAPDRSVTRQMLGHDFLAFYTAGSFVRQGRYLDLYNLDSVRDFEQSTGHAAGLEMGKSFGPWWNPPFYALVFEPLAALPYATALDAWRWISLVAVVMAIGILTSFVARASRPFPPDNIRGFVKGSQYGGLVPLLIVISMPFIQAFSHGQNTFTSLLFLTVTVALWRSEKRLLTGIACGLLFYKPQLGAVVAAAMVIDLGWISLAGVAITGMILLAVTQIAMPGSLADWLHSLPANVKWMQVDHAYLWERHVTLKSFWRLLLQGREAGEASFLTTALTDLSLLAIGGSLMWSIFQARNRRGSVEETRVHRDRAITAAVLAMPLLMPFYFDYDLLLLAVPATLYAVERIQFPDQSRPQDRWMTVGWVALFAWMFFNPAIALHTHLSGTVILLSGITILSIRRVNRPDGDQTPIFIIHPQRIAMAA
jgi:hypothetical protein